MKTLRVIEVLYTTTEIEITDEDFEELKNDEDYIGVLLNETDGEDCNNTKTIIEVEDEDYNVIYEKEK